MSSGSRGRPVVFVHIGGPKTGTTYLQELLWANRASLRRDGVLYPGRSASAHFLAAQDLLDAAFHGHRDPRMAGAWARLAEEARSAERVAVISHELLSLATPEAVGRAMDSLSWAAEVHVVYTMRDLARQIPSVWQEDLKNQHAVRFTRFVRGLRGEDPDPHWLVGLFWRFQDPVAILARWGAALPPERVHVVTVPPAGSAGTLLWDRFAGTVGIAADPAQIDLSRPRNTALGVVEANLLRRLNVALGQDFDWPTYHRWVQTVLVGHILAGRSGRIPLNLPAAEYEWVHAWAVDTAAGLSTAGYDVVGDLADVIPAQPAEDPDARHPDQAPPVEVLEAAVDVLAALVRTMAGTPARQSDGEQPPAPSDLPPMVLLRLAVQRLSAEHRSVALLRQGLAGLKRASARLTR